MKRTAEKISVILPVLNEEANISLLYHDLCEIIKKVSIANYEIIFVDNGSTDKTIRIVKKLMRKDVDVKLIISDNFHNKELSLLEGFSDATGEIVAFMDADFQHPPQLLADFYCEWQCGCDVVVAEKQNNFKNFYGFFYFSGVYIFEKLFKMKINISDFGLIDKKLLAVFSERFLSFPFRLVCSSFLSDRNVASCTIKYTPAERIYGRSKYSLISLALLYFCFFKSALIYYKKIYCFYFLICFFVLIVGLFSVIKIVV